MTIEGKVDDGPLCSRRWWTIDAPAYPAPMTTMSLSSGRTALDRWLSSASGWVRQNDVVPLGTGNDFGAMPAWGYDSSWRKLYFRRLLRIWL